MYFLICSKGKGLFMKESLKTSFLILDLSVRKHPIHNKAAQEERAYKIIVLGLEGEIFLRSSITNITEEKQTKGVCSWEARQILL